MVEFIDECVGCPTNMGCMASCPYKSVPQLTCDDCGEEADELYDIDGVQVCGECLPNHFEVTDETDHCVCCMKEDVILYDFEGEPTCKDCLMKRADKVELGG